MMGSILARPVLMLCGYVFPAYECYKFLERKDTDSETDQLKSWCHYWIIVALFTTCERVGDNVLYWLPLYDEVKVAFVLYLWLPKTRGSMYIYRSLLQPYMAKHEKVIDLYLVKMRNKANTVAASLWGKAVSYGQYGLSRALQFAYSQSAVIPQPNQQQRTSL